MGWVVHQWDGTCTSVLTRQVTVPTAYSHVVENTAFFGDVVLRFPKIVHHYFDRNSNWNSLIRWGIGFCNLTGVFEQGPHSQVLGLVRLLVPHRRVPSPLPGLGSEVLGVKGGQGERTPCQGCPRAEGWGKSVEGADGE